jgi:ABC-type bacteriocin/lantibiotic exporter with double-glycine peptidase domain
MSAAVAEYLILASIVPFIKIILNNNYSPEGFDFLFFEKYFDIDQLKYLFILLIICSGSLRILMQFYQNKFIYSFSHKISLYAFKNIIYQEYIWHKSKTSSNGLSVINSVFYLVGSFIVPITNLISGSIISLAIILALLYVNWKTTLIVLVISGIIYLTTMFINKKYLKIISESFARTNEQRIETTKESILGIRDVILNDLSKIFIKRFAAEDFEFNRVRALHNFLGIFPKYVIETIILTLIAIAAIFSSNKNIPLDDAFPILLLFFIAAQKLLPLINQFFVGWTSITGNEEIIQQVETILEMKIIKKCNIKKKLSFTKNIIIKDINFSYGKNVIFKNFNITIKKGEKIGIMGRSGGGKSTFLDLISGLINPDNGAVLINGNELTRSNSYQWWKNIQYVSQNPYILNSSILNNIVMTEDEEEVDYQKLDWVIDNSCLREFLDKGNSLNYYVGEGGKNLSGGQKQRLAIARSLYKKCDLLIWDEATSALDNKTEQTIIKMLPPNMTVIFVSHNKRALNFCDKIIEIDNLKVNKNI